MAICRYIRDPETGQRFFMPECIGGAVQGSRFCTCFAKKQARKKVERDLNALEELAVKTGRCEIVKLARDIRDAVERMLRDQLKT